MRWSEKHSKRMDSPRVDDFLDEINEVCKKHRLSISHEDGHGAFVIEAYDKFWADGLEVAFIGKSAPGDVYNNA